MSRGAWSGPSGEPEAGREIDPAVLDAMASQSGP